MIALELSGWQIHLVDDVPQQTAALRNLFIASLFIFAMYRFAKTYHAQQYSLIQQVQKQTDFMSHMSHQIRNPLQGIQGSIEIALSNSDKETRLNMLKRSLSSAKRLKELVDDMLNLDKLASGNFSCVYSDFALPRLIADVIDRYLNQADMKHISLTYEIAPLVPKYVHGPFNEINLILENLLSNAIKYTHAGRITLTVSYQRNALCLTLHDTGIGISASDQQRIFDKFTQVDNHIKKEAVGSGLGLPLVKELVTKLGGDIELQSKIDIGSTFIIDIPIAPATQPDEPEHPHDGRDNETVDFSDQRVLIVDDEEINRLILENFLTQCNMQCTLAHHGQEALTLLQHQDFDVIISDISMPIMSGLDFIRQYRQQYGTEIPVIALTGNMLPKQVAEYQQLGFDFVLGKPVDQQSLVAALQQLKIHLS